MSPHPVPLPGAGFHFSHTMTDNTKKPDWERIEADYRAGVLSIREIAASQGITDTAIRKRAKRDGWSRDLAAKVAAKADLLVRTAEVRNKVRTESAVSERELVDCNAETVANVRLSHRSDIARNRRLANDLLTELEAESTDKALFQQLADLMAAPDDKGVDKLNELYRKVISLPTRVDSAKKLAETLKTLIGLEREAYGINTTLPDEGKVKSGLGYLYGEDD